MTFRNPWIDPRVTDLRPEQAQAYLLRHGWKRLGPAANPLLLMFEGPSGSDGAATVLVPLERDQGPMLQRMIELVADVARHEDRWAVAVLEDILRQPGEPASENGPGVAASVESAPR